MEKIEVRIVCVHMYTCDVNNAIFTSREGACADNDQPDTISCTVAIRGGKPLGVAINGKV